MPDGGREFILDEPVLSSIHIDDRSTLQFGAVDLVIDGPFVVEIAGVVHHLDPRRWDALGPLVALYPAKVHWLWTSPRGQLTAVFEDGSRLTVEPDTVTKAWSVGTVYCMPTG
jgi:hypothetical protein